MFHCVRSNVHDSWIFITLLFIFTIPVTFSNDAEEIGETRSVSLLNEDIASVTQEYLNNTLVPPPQFATNETDIKSKNKTSLFISCYVNGSAESTPVEIVNATRLSSLLTVESHIVSRQVPGTCIAVFFYSPSCPFSCMAAPHFNALPRIFPDITMVAVNAMKYHSFNAGCGIVGVPTLMLFHNGIPAAKFNDTSEYTLEMFAKFITKYTALEPKGKLFVTSADFSGPVSSVPTKDRDMLLVLSWGFILVCTLHSFYRSSYWRWLVDGTVNVWREAEAHHHVD